MIDQIIRSKRRTLGLQITSEARLIVRAPRRASMDDIQRWVDRNLTWIQKHQKRLRDAALARPSRRAFVTGETFLFLGTPRPLAVIPEAAQALAFTETEFILDERCRSKARAHFEYWYRSAARDIISSRAAAAAKAAGLAYTSLRISGARTRWGSCSRSGRLNFSWRLVMAPLWVIDYVIAHELAHLLNPNHSPRFWEKVGELFPNYEEARRWLRKNHSLIELAS